MNICIGENIKRLRQANNMTQEKLAEYVNVSAPAISKWERGETLPDITMIMPLASYFNVSLDELLGFDIEQAKVVLEKRLDEYHVLHRAFRSDESTSAINALRRDYPNDFSVMMAYMTHFGGGRADENTPLLLEYADEFITLCERILNECTVMKIRLNASYVLAKIYKARGEYSKAVECFDDFPGWYETKDQWLEQLYEKYSDEFIHQVNKNLSELLQFAFNKAGKAIWYTQDSVEERDLTTKSLVAAIEGYINAVGYEDGWSFIEAIYHEGGKVLTTEGHYDKAIEYYAACLECGKRSRDVGRMISWMETTPFLESLREREGFWQMLLKYRE